jgi:hypothetical protein
MFGDPLVFAPGVCILLFQLVRRYRPVLKSHLVERFRRKVAELARDRDFRPQDIDGDRETLVRRAAAKVELWVGNAKRFNLIVLLCAAADWILLATAGPTTNIVLGVVFVAAGGISVLFLLGSIAAAVFGKRMVADIWEACRESSDGGG